MHVGSITASITTVNDVVYRKCYDYNVAVLTPDVTFYFLSGFISRLLTTDDHECHGPKADDTYSAFGLRVKI